MAAIKAHYKKEDIRKIRDELIAHVQEHVPGCASVSAAKRHIRSELQYAPRAWNWEKNERIPTDVIARAIVRFDLQVGDSVYDTMMNIITDPDDRREMLEQHIPHQRLLVQMERTATSLLEIMGGTDRKLASIVGDEWGRIEAQLLERSQQIDYRLLQDAMDRIVDHCLAYEATLEKQNRMAVMALTGQYSELIDALEMGRLTEGERADRQEYNAGAVDWLMQ